MSGPHIHDEEEGGIVCCGASLSHFREPIVLDDLENFDLAGDDPFWTWPVFGPLLFENQTSDARDHCANERTFLSYLRLSVYMAIVSVAIVLSFHLKRQPTEIELRMAKPLGAVFWCLSVASLLLGMGNYIRTVNKYSQRAAIVQTGWKTQSVMGTIALCIVGSCVTMLIINKLSEAANS